MTPVWYVIVLFLLCIQPILMCLTGDVRLIAGGTRIPLEGRVEICKNGSWGTVCDNNWDSLDAAVVCRQLGFSGGGSIALYGWYVSTYFSQGRGNIFLDLVDCDGSENTLRECPSSTQTTCDHSSDAGVRCSHTGSTILVFNGRQYPNNSIIPLQEVGNEFHTFNASVYCYTDRPCCNRSVSIWYRPSGIDLDFQVNYRLTWSLSGTVNLYRPPSSYISGIFFCRILDQFLYVGIYQQGLIIGIPFILSFTYERSSKTLSCLSTGGPATRVFWSKDSVLLNVDGVDYEQSQIVLNTGLATYENKLAIKLSSPNVSYGLYRCDVRNVKGSSVAELRVSSCSDGDAIFEPSTGAISQICRDGYYYYVSETLNVPTEAQPTTEMSSTPGTDTKCTTQTTQALSTPTEYNTPCPVNGGDNQQIKGGTSNLVVIILGALFGVMVVIVLVLITSFGIILSRKKNIKKNHQVLNNSTLHNHQEDSSHEFNNELYVNKEADSISIQYNQLYATSKTVDYNSLTTADEDVYEVMKEGSDLNIYENSK